MILVAALVLPAPTLFGQTTGASGTTESIGETSAFNGGTSSTVGFGQRQMEQFSNGVSVANRTRDTLTQLKPLGILLPPGAGQAVDGSVISKLLDNECYLKAAEETFWVAAETAVAPPVAILTTGITGSPGAGMMAGGIAASSIRPFSENFPRYYYAGLEGIRDYWAIPFRSAGDWVNENVVEDIYAVNDAQRASTSVRFAEAQQLGSNETFRGEEGAAVLVSAIPADRVANIQRFQVGAFVNTQPFQFTTQSSTGGFEDVAISGSSNLRFTLLDSGNLEDGDRVFATVASEAGRREVGNVTLTFEGENFSEEIASGPVEVRLEALNEGSAPPNTGGIRIRSEVESGPASQDYELDEGDVGVLRIRAK